METLTAHNCGIDIAYQHFGASGDPLLLVMGIAADMLSWHNDFCAVLVENGFPVVRFDNRDSGESRHLYWAGTPTVAGFAAAPIPRPTGWRTWPMTPPRSSTHSAGHQCMPWVMRWAGCKQLLSEPLPSNKQNAIAPKSASHAEGRWVETSRDHQQR